MPDKNADRKNADARKDADREGRERAAGVPPEEIPGEESEGGAEPTGTPSPAPDVEAMKATIASLEDRVRRQQADFVNELRRLQRQADERVKFAAQPVVEDILGVAYALHRAIDGLADTEHERRVAEGLRMVERQLLDGLARHGVTRIEALGKPFDPAVHEAILEIESDEAPRSVLQVVRPGFSLHGRVVRPAHVVVAKGKAKADGRRAGAAPAEADGD